jgi:hypothetical protein
MMSERLEIEDIIFSYPKWNYEELYKMKSGGHLVARGDGRIWRSMVDVSGPMKDISSLWFEVNPDGVCRIMDGAWTTFREEISRFEVEVAARKAGIVGSIREGWL